MVLTLIVSSITAIATAIYAFLVYRTVIEMKAQRESAYRPDIIIDESRFYIYGYEMKNNIFPREYSLEDKGMSYKTTNLEPGFIEINLFNVGLATAKDVNILFNIEVDNCLETIEILNKKIDPLIRINVSKGENGLHIIPAENAPMVESFHFFDNQINKKFNHILPINIDRSPVKIALPSFLLELQAILIYLFWLDTTHPKNFPYLLTLKVQLDYLDLGNQRIKKDFELLLEYNGGTKEQSLGSIKANEK